MNKSYRITLFGLVAFLFIAAGSAANDQTAGSNLIKFPREKLLLDQGWRFQLGDPTDVTTNVTDYPEIAYIAQLKNEQVSGPGSETSVSRMLARMFILQKLQRTTRLRMQRSM